MSFAYHDNGQLKRLDADKLPPPSLSPQIIINNSGDISYGLKLIRQAYERS